MPRWKSRLDVFEWHVRFVGRTIQVQNRPRGYQEGAICPSVRVVSTIVVYNFVLKSIVAQLTVEQLAVSVQVAKVKRPEIEEEVPIHEVIVNAEEPFASLLGRIRRESYPI